MTALCFRSLFLANSRYQSYMRFLCVPDVVALSHRSWSSGTLSFIVEVSYDIEQTWK